MAFPGGAAAKRIVLEIVGWTLVVIDRTVSAIGSSRPIWSVLLPDLCSSADWAMPVPRAANTREGPDALMSSLW